MTIVQDATKVLLKLATFSKGDRDPEAGRHYLDGDELKELTGLSPSALSDAVDVLEENGYGRVRRAIGTGPYSFLMVQATPRGRVEAERIAAAEAQQELSPPSKPGEPSAVPIPIPVMSSSPTPVGSPYGFTEQDWAAVAVAHSDRTRLIVRLGFQWSSTQYDAAALHNSIQVMFTKGLTAALPRNAPAVVLDFRRLEGGYGGHLFNEIARDIIGADVVVVDTSDLNANVMIELGVALTWGVSLLPIRSVGSPKPPSDISGQTWAEYEDSGRSWTDPRHDQKLEKLIQHVLRRKGAV